MIDQIIIALLFIFVFILCTRSLYWIQRGFPGGGIFMLSVAFYFVRIILLRIGTDGNAKSINEIQGGFFKLAAAEWMFVASITWIAVAFLWHVHEKRNKTAIDFIFNLSLIFFLARSVFLRALTQGRFSPETPNAPTIVKYFGADWVSLCFYLVLFGTFIFDGLALPPGQKSKT